MDQRPTPTTHPARPAVRDLLERRRAERTPPPPPEQVRQELGWWLIPGNRS